MKTLKFEPIYISKDLIDLSDTNQDWTQIEISILQTRVCRTMIFRMLNRYIHIDISLLKRVGEKIRNVEN
jgi:hypothetical protein